MRRSPQRAGVHRCVSDARVQPNLGAVRPASIRVEVGDVPGVGANRRYRPLGVSSDKNVRRRPVFRTFRKTQARRRSINFFSAKMTIQNSEKNGSLFWMPQPSVISLLLQCLAPSFLVPAPRLGHVSCTQCWHRKSPYDSNYFCCSPFGPESSNDREARPRTKKDGSLEGHQEVDSASQGSIMEGWGGVGGHE